MNIVEGVQVGIDIGGRTTQDEFGAVRARDRHTGSRGCRERTRAHTDTNDHLKTDATGARIHIHKAGRRQVHIARHIFCRGNAGGRTGDARLVIDTTDRHTGLLRDSGATSAIAQDKTHRAHTGSGRIGIGVLVADVLHQRLGRCRVGAGIQGNDQRVAARATGKAANKSAAVGHIGTRYANLARTAALVANAQHVFGTVAAGHDRNRQRTGVELG